METRVKREEEWVEDSEFEQEIENSPPPDIGKTGDRERWIENGKKRKEKEEEWKGQANDRKGFFTLSSDENALAPISPVTVHGPLLSPLFRMEWHVLMDRSDTLSRRGKRHNGKPV